MKLTTIATTILVTLSGTVSAASCKQSQGDVFTRYTVTADGVGNSTIVCGRLWKYLARFPCTPSQTHCGGKDGNLKWRFYATTFCNKGMVASSWWEATRNKFGSLKC